MCEMLSLSDLILYKTKIKKNMGYENEQTYLCKNCVATNYIYCVNIRNIYLFISIIYILII